MHFSRLRTAYFLLLGVGEVSLQRPPGQRPPYPRTETPWKGHGTRDSDRPLEGTLDQAARHEVTSYRDPPPLDRQTPVKTLPCSKLPLRAITRKTIEHIFPKIWGPHNFAKFQLNEHTPDFFASMLKGSISSCLLQAIPNVVETLLHYRDFKHQQWNYLAVRFFHFKPFEFTPDDDCDAQHVSILHW